MPPVNGVPRRSFEGHPLNLVYRALLFVFVATVVLLQIPGAREQLATPEPGIHMRNLVVQSIGVGSPNVARDIAPGDVIFAVAGQRIRNHIHYQNILARNRTGEPLPFTLMRSGEKIEVLVDFDPPRVEFRDVAYPLVAFFFLLVGLWVYLRRPDALGSLFAANCAMLASFLTHRPSTSLPALQLAGEMAHDAVILFFPAVLLHFFLLFPDRDRDRPARPVVRLLLVYAPPALLYATTAYLTARRFIFAPVNETLVTALLGVSSLYFGAYVVASLWTFMRGYRASWAAQRQKLRVVILGALAGFTPFLALTVYRSISPGQSSLLETAAALCLAFVPATFAYAILKHGAIELNVVVRKSIVYAFLSAAIIAVYYALVHVLGDVVMGEFGLSNALVMPVAAIVLALVFAPAREHIQRVVDRLFYRGEYVYKQEVFDFNRQLARKLDKDEIYAHFFERVGSLLRSSYIAVYSARDDRNLELDRTSGAPPSLPADFSLDSFLGRYFTRYKTPLMVEFLDPAWERPKLDLESRRFLSVEGLAVCVPVVAPDQFVAVIVLGEKLSGATYRRADTELLETFAEQLALVLQNVDLMQSSLEKERLKGEVMLARDIQLSLLPTVPPEHESVEMRGQMMSSFEIGGDYFDYFTLDDGHAGIAIGDVSGKGVPAAMLMSSIQSVFKNLALKAGLGPAELNAELNEHLCASAKPDQFATFFYAVYEYSTSTLAFSNAGHCPALLVKDGYADRLGTGGMVLGVRPDQRYHEGSVRLEPGDLLLLYTDGVTEQKDDEGEEYGEERLIAFLRSHENLPLEQLQSALVDDVIAFGNGRQDDDVTTVIVRHRTA